MKKVLVAAGAAFALALAGCGGQSEDTGTAGTSTAVDGVQFDQGIHDKLPQAVRDRGAIRLVTEAGYAPMEQFAADGRTIIGFEPDLANALGSVLGIKVEMTHGDFTTSIDEVVAGKYDGVLSSMTDTLEREKKVDFVNYFTAGTSILVQRGNPKAVSELNDLCGQVVAVEGGTVQADLLRRTQRGCDDPMTIHAYDTSAEALLQLRTGRAAAVLSDFPPAVYLVTDQRTRSFYQLSSTIQYEPGLFGIAFAKDDTALRDAVRDALDRLIRSGAYTELLERWGLGSGALVSSSINAGSGFTPGG